jgi:hypothetical protein
MTQEQFKKPWYQLTERTVQYALSGNEKVENVTGIPGIVGHLFFISTVGLSLLLVALGALGMY